ncbi:MAG: RHS repeat protein [Planctomycetes bacterium]|nr:RHS repeat protein [Planctomycetota bacterium]
MKKLLRKKRIFTSIISVLLMTILALPPNICAFDVPWDSGHSTFEPESTDEGTICPSEKCREIKQKSPVHIVSGNYSHSHQDLFIPGQGLSLVVTRTYDSQDRYNGPFGHGWKFNYEIKLTETTNEVRDLVVVRREDGIRLEFLKNPDGTYSSSQGRQDQLTNNSDGTFTWCEEAGGCSSCGTCYSFDASGRISSLEDNNDSQTSFSYDGTGKLIQVTDDSGRKLTISYGTNNKIKSITDPAKRIFQYGYDKNGNLITYTDPLGGITRYAYDARHRMISVTDAGGNTVSNVTYDAKNRVGTDSEKAEAWKYTYDPQNKTTYKDAADGSRWTFTYNNADQMVYEKDPLGNEIHYTWDDRANLSSRTDAKGNKMTYTYDERGNRTFTTDPLGHTTTYTYNLTFNKIATITDPLGHITKYEYDSDGNVIKSIQDFGGPLENETEFVFDSLGNVKSITDPLGGIFSFVYDANGNYVKITDSLGNISTFTYDDRGNKLTETDNRGNTTIFTYDLLDRVTGITDASGNTITYTYDRVGNLSSVTDADGKTISYTYDPYGNPIQIQDPSSAVTQYTYNSKGQQTSVIDANGNKVLYHYDAVGRLVSEVNTLGKRTSYLYDANGNFLSMTDAEGNKTAYSFDGLNQITQITYPDGLKKSYTYDSVGNIISETDRKGETTTFTYDKLNRQITKTYSDDTKVTYAYDALGRLISAANKFGTKKISYDALYRVTSVEQDGKTVSYEYDSSGNRTKFTYPDGKYITYTYDALDRLDQIKGSDGLVIADYAYDNLDRRIQLDLKNGTKTVYQYDQIGRLSSLVNKVSATDVIVSSFTYGYDQTRNRTSLVTQEGIHSYSYDKTNQLVGVDYPDGYDFADATYNYSAVGNRISQTDGGTTNYTTNKMNQYTSVGGTNYTYDANGNLTSDGTNSYLYDFEDRLVQVDTPTDTITYTYGPMGRRISKSVNGATTHYVYDDNRVIEEGAPSGEVRDYIYGTGIDEVLSMIKRSDSKVYYYHYDGLGSVTDITDNSGKKVEAYSYDVYGKQVIRDGSGKTLTDSLIGNRYTFTGRRLDVEDGLHYYRARYYSANMGRFLQMDPIGNYTTDDNLYRYVRNNPLNLVDPLGLWEWQEYQTAITFFAGTTAAVVVIVATGGLATPLVVSGGVAVATAQAVGASALAGAATYTAIERTKKNPTNCVWTVIKGAFVGVMGGIVPIAYVYVPAIAAERAAEIAAGSVSNSYAGTSAIAAYEAGNKLMAEWLARLAGYNSLSHLLEFRDQLARLVSGR